MFFTREGLVHNISALCHGEHDFENQRLIHTAYCYFINRDIQIETDHLSKVAMHSQTDLSTKNKASVVSEEFYGLNAEIYGPQRFNS